MKVEIRHDLLVFAIALIAIFMIASTASAEDVNTLRIYGEDGLSAAFPYTDPEAPFDPMNIESPMKDFVTFNPALMEDAIVVNNIDSKQKVFARQWFVPEYTEPTGMVWLDEVEGNWTPNHNEYVWEDVVTEYTYMFVDKHYQPREATSRSPSDAYWTKFWFPVADSSDEQIGLDGCDINYDGVPDMVYLQNVGDYNADGYKDIEIVSQMLTVKVNEKVQFLDHIAQVKGIFYDGDGQIDSVTVEIFYNGNAEPESLGEFDIDVGGDTLSAGRHTVRQGVPDFYDPWGIEVVGTSTINDAVRLRVGRQLYTRETFFVDGAEYDVAAIYGSISGTDDDNVKYITIRNPVPEHQVVEINDLSIVKEMVDNDEYLPLLPPFNKMHTMVDDINIPHNAVSGTGYLGSSLNSAAPDGEWYTDNSIVADYDTVEERKIYDVDPLLIYFTDKTNEARFHTDLLEMLDEPENREVAEAWKWLHIRTMPDFYKNFVYPELPDADDGTGDFLFTSSFRAENSVKGEIDNFVCNPVVWPQRLMFAYDQETGAEDIYVNEIDTETNGLRVYGEANMDANFPYDDPEAPFDPLSPEAPEKDFVTLNPAKIKAGIVVDNKDSHEKVFFRQWFVPEYTEPTGMVWLDEVYGTYIDKHNHYVWEDVINEYTYMFIDKHFQPTAGMATADGNPENFSDFMSQDNGLWTFFWFPVSDMDDTQIGLDSMDMNYDGDDDMTYLLAATDFNGDARKDIAIGSETFTVAVGDKIQFLDHIAEIEGIYYNGNGLIDSVAVEIYYNGNTIPESLGTYDIDVGQGILSAGRHTVRQGEPDFYDPWAMQITATSTINDKVRIRVGRLLHTSETFFVDGAEYDVAMIYGPEDNSVKYITIRNPLPEHKDISLNDLSVVKKAVYDGDIMPVLPPFNGEHIMIDDIDVPHSLPAEGMTCYYGQWWDTAATDDLLWYHDMYVDGAYDTVAERMFMDVPATEIYFTGKDYESRFHTNLLEILREGCGSVLGAATADTIDNTETWKWLHIMTMPDFYKEFVYPDVPNAGGNGDYLLTSSFTAPNSDVCGETEEYRQRIMFTFDPTDGTGIYMNGGAVPLPPVEPPVSEMKGDINGDEVVNIFDFVAFAQAYNTVEGDEKYNVVFDFDENGNVNIIDFVQFAGVYEFES